jgi:DNA-binding GntR family transcriptional regulator
VSGALCDAIGPIRVAEARSCGSPWEAMTKPTKAKPIHQAIADDIVHGRLLPGASLDETSIAGTFGVSRTPIREAIRQLEAIGLVETRGQRGAVVAALSDRQLDEMFAVMAELEALCARWCAVAMTADERRHLLALQDESARLVSAGRREAYVDFNNRFHEAIYRGAHNSFLTELAVTVRKRCAPFRRAQFETLGRLAKSHAEHGAVVEAIQRGDAQMAAVEMRAHIVVVRDAVDVVAGEAMRRERPVSSDSDPRSGTIAPTTA